VETKIDADFLVLQARFDSITVQATIKLKKQGKPLGAACNVRWEVE